MGFGEAVRTCVAKTFTWGGRATRSEFWWFMLLVFPVASVGLFLTYLLPEFTGAETAWRVVRWLLFIAAFVPTLAVLIRRLHDTGRSGAWYWIRLIPFIGDLIILIFMLLPSQPDRNEWGDDPFALTRRGQDPAYGDTVQTYWCANKDCRMRSITVTTPTCTNCGQPTRAAEPA